MGHARSRQKLRTFKAPWKIELFNGFSFFLLFYHQSRKPSEALACVLSSMGENIKKVKVLDTSKIDDKQVEVIVKIIDKQGVETRW